MIFLTGFYEITFEFLVILILLGFGIGIISTLSGVGGGFLMVPLFLLLLDLTPTEAKGTSLFVIFLSAGVATITHHRNGNLCWRYLLIFSIISIGGSVICTILLEFISIEKQIFSFIFGGVEILIVIQLIFQARFRMKVIRIQKPTSNNEVKLGKNFQSFYT